MTVSEALSESVVGGRLEQELEAGWQRLSAWSLVFFVFRGIRQLVDSAFYFLLPAGAAVLNAGSWAIWLALGLLALLIAVSLLGAYLHFRRFRFRFGEDRLEVRQGIFQRKHTELHYRRVQNLSVEKPWYFRPLGLATLKVDSAGSAESEVHLAAITEARAEGIREHLFRQQHVDTVQHQEDSDGEQRESDARVESSPVHQASWRDLLVFSFSNAAVVFFFAMLGPILGSGVFVEVIDALEESISGPWLWLLNNSLVKLFMLIGLIVTLIQVILTGAVAMTMLRYYNFRLFADGSRFRTLAGLLTERERTLRQEKIQNLVLERPMLTYWRGRTTLRCQQVGSSLEQMAATGNVQQGGAPSFLVPAVPNEQVPALAAGFVPGLDSLPNASEFQGVHPRIWRLSVLGWAVPVVGASIGAGFAFGLMQAVVLFLLSSAFVVWASRRRWRRWGYCLHGDHLFVRSGFIGEKITAVASYRVQGVRIRRSPLQRWRGLADLQLRLASGSLEIPSMAIVDARALANYVLYRSSVTRSGWI